MITDHSYRPHHGVPGDGCAWLGTCGEPVERHEASVTVKPTGGRRLEEADVLRIRDAAEQDGANLSEIGRGFGVSRQTVSAIKAGRVWRRAGRNA